MRLFVILCMLIAIATPALAQESHDVTVHARESDCPASKTYCFVIDGSMPDIEAGDQVTFTLVNQGNFAHELVVVPLSEADPDHEATSEDEALGEIEEIGPGEQDSATFTVPAGGLYIWCALSGHEQLGMWTEIPTGGAASGGGSDNGAPLPVTFLLIALAIAATTRR